MNDEPIDDPELRRPLDAVRDELLARHPRRDTRIEYLLGATPPAEPLTPVGTDLTAELPVDTSLPVRRRGRLVGGLVAAVLVLVGGFAALALRSDDDPSVAVADGRAGEDAIASLGQEPDDADPVEPVEPDPSADQEGTFEEHREWIGCVIDAVKDAIDSDDHDLDVDPRALCGEPPVLDLEKLELDFGHFDFDFEEWERSDGFFGFEGWDTEKWGAGLWDLDGLCENDSTDDGVSVQCSWPPCEGDDCVPLECPDDADGAGCFGFGFHFDGDLRAELEEWTDGWPDWSDQHRDQQESPGDA